MVAAEREEEAAWARSARGRRAAESVVDSRSTDGATLGGWPRGAPFAFDLRNVDDRPRPT
jgi:hypothetical protein